MRSTLQKFIRLESASAWLLLAATILALFMSNSSWSEYYNSLLHYTFALHFFDTQFNISLLHLTNEGLMAFFFLVVTLEIKYELCYGALNSFSKACLPGIAAIGGMVVPALIYIIINYRNAIALQGWAIPTATDIAFSLGVLTLLGTRIPSTLKIFLMALAIFDDLAAIMVIAVFYTEKISFLFLLLAGIIAGLLVILNVKKIKQLFPYSILGVCLWFCILKSGIHPTLAGGLLAFLIPLRSFTTIEQSPSYKLKHRLHPWVAFCILPLFAFTNAGVSLISISLNNIELPVILGILLGLFVGKPLGIFGFSWLSNKLHWVQLPANTRWRDLCALSFLCGIGFTISLFIGALAFDNYSTYLNSVKISVILGSLLSGFTGYILLSFGRQNEKASSAEQS